MMAVDPAVLGEVSGRFGRNFDHSQSRTATATSQTYLQNKVLRSGSVFSPLRVRTLVEFFLSVTVAV